VAPTPISACSHGLHDDAVLATALAEFSTASMTLFLPAVAKPVRELCRICHRCCSGCTRTCMASRMCTYTAPKEKPSPPTPFLVSLIDRPVDLVYFGRVLEQLSSLHSKFTDHLASCPHTACSYSARVRVRINLHPHVEGREYRHSASRVSL